jgi:hypothetical protein
MPGFVYEQPGASRTSTHARDPPLCVAHKNWRRLVSTAASTLPDLPLAPDALLKPPRQAAVIARAARRYRDAPGLLLKPRSRRAARGARRYRCGRNGGACPRWIDPLVARVSLPEQASRRNWLRREPAASAHASAGHPEQSSPKLAADDCSLESCALTRRVLRLAALPVSGRSRVRCSRPGSGPSRRPTGRARCRAGRRPRSWLRSRGRSRPRRP